MKRKVLATVLTITTGITMLLAACGNAQTEETTAASVVGTEYVYAENDTHTLLTTYSDGTTETGAAENCNYGETGTCSVCGHVYEIPKPVVTALEETSDYVATTVVSTYQADCKYAEVTGEVGTADEATIVKVTGITANEWYQLEDGSFVMPENLTERAAYEETNGKIYTVAYFDEPKTLYCQESSNIRVLPEDGAEVSYKKSTNDEVTVLGICNEAEWYYLEDGNWTLKSNLGESKVEIKATQTVKSCPYTLNTIFYDNAGFPYAYCYGTGIKATMTAEELANMYELQEQMFAVMNGKGYSSMTGTWWPIGKYVEGNVILLYIATDDHPAWYLGSDGLYYPVDTQSAYGISTAY